MNEIKEEVAINDVPAPVNEKAEEAPKLTPEQEKEENERELREFLLNEKNQIAALELATQMQEAVGKGWFTLDRAALKFKENKASALHKIKLVEQFGYIAKRTGDSRDNIKILREMLYQVVISNEAKIAALDRIIQQYQDQIKSIELKKKMLSN
jgi:hypothetical protein